MRVEWALNSQSDGPDKASGQSGFDLEGFRRAFAPLAADLGMHWKLTSGARLPRVALFCSQYLHCMADLLYRWRAGELECEIPLIVSNHREVESLAVFYGVPFEHVEITAATRDAAEQRQLEVLSHNEIELVMLARYMRSEEHTSEL